MQKEKITKYQYFNHLIKIITQLVNEYFQKGKVNDATLKSLK